MIHKPQILLFSVLLLLSSCITQFIPEIDEEKELLVVQGLITDRMEPDTIKLSKSLPLGEISAARPVSGGFVTITDDLHNVFLLSEIVPGTYITPSYFHGVTGRSYTLHINANSEFSSLNYESFPMEMKPVPPIDSLYYEKTVIEKADGYFRGVDGCQIYLDTYDPENKCRFYRWDFSETWKLRLLFDVPNQTCWISDKSHSINIKSTAAFNEARINRFPINYFSNMTDRLKTKYSILVNQYSLNEDEYIYWEKIQNIAVQVGGLYDIIPASVPSNIRCIEDPTEKVLGYFSVSAISSKRIFIKDKFEGIIDQYAKCASDTLLDGPDYIEGLGISVWTLFDIIPTPFSGKPRIRIFTETRGCADCTVRGTTVKPVFWPDDK
ncbi:MAG: DUF4249 domain-containing protein [Bacteroidia bacterium]|nr:DUF4249 domain-containing protein [Bacteroidia bacterium]